MVQNSWKNWAMKTALSSNLNIKYPSLNIIVNYITCFLVSTKTLQGEIFRIYNN